ncbi:MAG: hypothetical protein JST52_12335 [Bacteroidetes bacterium]|nr:hypothetical protein [Bacteroidota bacterium]MBS1738928.1 hypothetical protein [Bacteroidota bacterium]
MKIFLRLVSSFVFLAFFSCSTPYSKLTQVSNVPFPVWQFKPQFEKELYRCVVDGRFLFKKFHLSGILLLKQFQDNSTRAVFQNEMGFTFFDFEWNQLDSFKVNQIIPQLDKPALIKLLEKDMNLFLMKGLNAHSEADFMANNESLYRFSLDKGFAYFIATKDTLKRIENVGKKKVITIKIGEKKSPQSLPSSAIFIHHKANFTIKLKAIDEHVYE